MLIFFLWGLGWIATHDLDQRIEEALRDGDTETYHRLLNEKIEVQRWQQETLRANDDQRWMQAFMLLDAAEHGIFLSDPDAVFGGQDTHEYQYDGYDDWRDYDGCQDYYDSGCECEDHWGPV